jgi:flagellar biogenesis protein FliO
MTLARQVFHAALLLAALAAARPAHAEESAAVVGPPTAEQAAEAARASARAAESAAAPPASAPSTARAPAGQGAGPSWLAQRPTPKPPVAGGTGLPSTSRLIGLVLVVVSLGGAALYLKRRTRVEGRRVTAPKRLAVVSSTRIGPKAHAVVISVAGRQMLLGVTDASVKRLAFIDELEEDAEELEREPARRGSPLGVSRGSALPTRSATPEPAARGAFSSMLKTAFKKREVPEVMDAASILAAETQDTVAGKPVAPSARMLDVEGQAQGLIRRLSGPRV